MQNLIGYQLRWYKNSFEFSEKAKDQNGTRIFVKLEEDTPSSLQALKELCRTAFGFGFRY